MPAIVTVQDVVLRLACALLAGVAIGLNRETKGQAAGLRTTVLVCLAAALAGLEANLLLGAPTGPKAWSTRASTSCACRWVSCPAWASWARARLCAGATWSAA